MGLLRAIFADTDLVLGVAAVAVLAAIVALDLGKRFRHRGPRDDDRPEDW